uniref:Casein kinase II subunit beta n=1 Tax=Kalanchoe fedtschenkoi TaxID=63787 RepID=A0A7N0V5F4_KALFE
MYRDRGGGGGSAKSELDRKRITDALDKHLEKASASSSKALAAMAGGGKDKERLVVPLTSTGKPQFDHPRGGGSLPEKNKLSDVVEMLEEVLSSDMEPYLLLKELYMRRKQELARQAKEESETDSDEESDVSGSDVDDTSWISWFCNLRGNEFFCEVDDEYIQDDFNLCGLSSQVPYYDYALDLILDVESSHSDMFTEEQNELVESAAEMLYGLIHVRYILTSKGMTAMLEKYKNYDFGRCPRGYCCGQPCLPVGQSDIPRSSTVKIYCPKCEDIYYPRSKYQDIDGAYFGTTFPHMFLMTYGHLKPPKPTQSYVPRVFGFKLHKP